MPLRDFRCEACGQQQERFFHSSVGPSTLECGYCSSPLTMLELSAGVHGKTGVFPFTSTHFDGAGRPIVVESLGALRALEKKYGVVATAFSQEPSNPDSPRDLPEHRPGGKAYEGFRFPKHCRDIKEKGIRDAVRAIETGRFKSGIKVR